MVLFNCVALFCRVVCGKRFTMNLTKPYEIRNTTMKNFVENASENSRNHWVKNPVKSQMLKWESEGGGGSM
jgi:hypothetical protein